MRFNKAELASLVSNPKTEFEKEGLLIITERQEGFFRSTDVNYPHWCKLRGNLLFYLKDHEPNSAPVGIIVLENCRPLIRNENREFDGFAFILEFEGSLPKRICTNSARERLDWVKAIQLASYMYLNRQIAYLQEQISLKMGNKIETGTAYPNAVQATIDANLAHINTNKQNKVEEGLSEVPICESALSCDNLPYDSQGRAPNVRVVCSVLDMQSDCLWRDFACTEMIEHTINPQFLCTICFRKSYNFNADSLLRFTVLNVREKLTATAVPLGYAEVVLGVIQDATRFRIPLRSSKGECGFITIASWAPDTEKQTPPRSTTQVFEQQSKGHRRSQSLPPKLGVKLFVPFQGCIQIIYTNPTIHTYRLHSSIGGDISVHETMLESKLCFSIPQQLLSIWIQREKELLQELSGMGELGGEWRRRQMDLLDKHLKLLTDYSQAKQNLQQMSKKDGPYFKQSSVKTDESLEFLPINLHLQRMWAHNDNLNRTGVLDIITVGAFTRHAAKSRTGGLIKLLQGTKESPSKFDSSNACKVQAANDAVQAIKQLRKEIVEIMSQILCLAKSKNPKGMMTLCNEMVIKTKTLLNLWEPNLVDEAFAFIEKHRIIEEPDNMLMPLSPFRKITQQLNALDLKSPELEDFATPVVAPPDLWPRHKIPTSGSSKLLVRSNSFHLQTSPLAVDMNEIFTLHRHVKNYNEQLKSRNCHKSKHDNDYDYDKEQEEAEATFQSLPVNWQNTLEHEKEAQESIENSMLEIVHVDEGPHTSLMTNSHLPYVGRQPYETFSAYDEPSLTQDHFSTAYNLGFLDTKVMSSSPSANYYRPTEEPEPLDLTQLNIEASVMCLVSKIKFLCGRCASPAIRLRHPKPAMKREGFSNTLAAPPDVVVNHMPDINSSNPLNLNLLNENSQRNGKKGNKFTDGLDLSLTTDWASELRPSMRKLRHAMDGLLKTARLIHSVQRLQQDMKRNSINLEIMYRRDVCFSQALSALVSALMAKLWGTEITENFIRILTELGPLAYFEGLLSLCGSEADFWGDMCIAIEDLCAVNFTLVRGNLNSKGNTTPIPRVMGSRQALQVLLPVPEHVYTIMPTKMSVTFKVTPVFFNIGINEKATLAETMGMTREQHSSNLDNYVRLKQYYCRYRKLNLATPDTPSKHETHLPPSEALLNILNIMAEQLKSMVSKNVKILHLAEDACRLMSGLRFTSCKSAKDRTGMSVTLEQCRVLVQEFQLPTKSVPIVLDTMRSEGTRMDNVFKNINKRKYAFNLPQVLALPSMYRPPVGSYGKAET